MAKPGPKPKIDAVAMRRVYDVLSLGGSMGDAADTIGVAIRTLRNAKADNPEFCLGIKKAVQKGKVRLLKKIGKAPQWQAAAWMLERRWGKQYGRKDRAEVAVSGTMSHTHSTDDDLRRILSDTRSAELANALARRLALHARGDGQSAN